jgi:type I restriction enzyme S subunit
MNLFLIRTCKIKTDQKFIFYQLKAKEKYVKSFAIGTATATITKNAVKNLDIDLPPLSTQQKIVGILSAYDDLIENNTRRIEILEEMARMLYREWFVKFRFPGHESVQFVESELGLIPEGWEVKKLKEVCKHINYGYTAKAKEIQEKPEEPKLLRITDIVPSIIDWDKVPYCEIEEGKIHKYLLSEGDIVIARTGATVGYAKRLHKRHQKTIFASYLVRLKVDESIVNNEYIGIIIESDEYKEFIKANMTGSAQPQANAQIMTSLSIIIPPLNLQKMFKELVTNFLDQKEILQIKNINLRKTRDLLLPRLISGEIDVENLAINTGI